MIDDFDCCAPRQGGHDVPDPSSRALASALTRVRVMTARLSDVESELAALKRDYAELEDVISDLRLLDQLSSAPDWPGWNALNSVWTIIRNAPTRKAV